MISRSIWLVTGLVLLTMNSWAQNTPTVVATSSTMSANSASLTPVPTVLTQPILSTIPTPVSPVPTLVMKATKTVDDTYILPEVTVYGEHVGIAQKEITGELIDQVRDTGDLGLALDQQSGIETQGEGMGKAWNTLDIRGQSFRETVILVNGVRVPESFNLGTIPTESIVKVEVLEGPQALVYGSDAVGGVVNIITRDAGDNSWNLQAMGGDFNTYQFQGSTGSFKVGAIQNTLSGSWFTTDGYLPNSGTVTLNNGNGPVTILGFADELHWDVSHAASVSIDNDLVTLSSSFIRQIGSAPDADNIVAAGTDEYDVDGRQDTWGVQSVLKDVHPLQDHWTLTSAFNGNYSNVLRSNPIGADPTSGVYPNYLNQYLDFGGQIYASGSAGDLFPQLSFGLEGKNETLWSGIYGNVYRNEGSFAASGTLKLDNSLHLNLANRLDDYNDYGISDNPSGSLVFDATKDWQIHLSAGEGYKTPSFDQLYLPPTIWSTTPSGIPVNVSSDLLQQMMQSNFFTYFNGTEGNPNLAPEQSLDTELGTDISAGDLSIQLSGFANFYTNLINPYLNSDVVWTYVNIPSALFIGTEDSVKVKLTDFLSPYTSATWISATDQNGNPIQGRLHFKWVMGLEVRPEKQWSMDASIHYVERNPVALTYQTDFNEVNGGAPVTPSDYWDASLDVKYKVSEHTQGFFDIENVLNEQMASFQGVPLPGRTFEGGLQTSF